MLKDSKIYIAGHSGTLGKTLYNVLIEKGFNNIIVKTRKELDLVDQKAVVNFFIKEKPEYVFLCAAKLDTLGLFTPADVIYENSMLQANIIHSSYQNNVKKLIFYGSAWAYPQKAINPIKEENLLDGKLDFKAIAYGLPKIIGTKMCESYNLQYETNFITLYLTNLYGETTEFDLQKAKVLPALLRKFHLAKLLDENKINQVLKDLQMSSLKQAMEYLQKFGISKESVEIWGSGDTIREFIHAKDLADASIYVMQNIDFKDTISYNEPHLNVGSGEFLSIKELAFLIKNIVGFNGEIVFNNTKPDSTMDRILDSSRLQNLGWKAKIKLEDGIKMMYNWYLKEQNIRQ
ncbi:NAD-dependent epimerase/dehydratase family protein [Campylobacter sp. TTU-622]|uniref:NAD-dependent epimerase/dehydratase family protein n=1 Tax=Campylobacter sp. TTU-622 TaxID=2800583 RepID=UPI001905958C|nr:NAD-dependent epimerase/dehydratase family protein [Campylobacter sp. TTU-622]MBK1973496.1 NAD-dependent epimerase/dehydratase family protein [Campylobacter sp. TTU-622]